MKKSEQEKVAAAAGEMGKESKPANDGMPDLSGFNQVSSEIWRPMEGEWIMGVYDGNEVMPDEYKLNDQNKDAVVLIHFIIDDRSSQRVSFVGGQMLDKWLEMGQAAKGDRVFVMHTGKGETRGGNKVNNWDVRIQKKA